MKKIKEKELVIIERSEPQIGVYEEKHMLYLNPDYSISDLNDSVMLTPSVCSAITKEFGKYLKISTADKNNHIFRMCRSQVATDFTDDKIALTRDSLWRLKIKDDYKVLIESSWWFPFYWNHPFHATRISMRIGLIGAFLSLASLIISILAIII